MISFVKRRAGVDIGVGPAEHKDVLPSLNEAQITKLKQLTLVSLAQDSRVCTLRIHIRFPHFLMSYYEHQILPYSRLLSVLEMPTIRELEDLIIDAIYLDIVRGKLDQREQQFEVEYTMGRDLEPGKLEQLLVSLQNWYVLYPLSFGRCPNLGPGRQPPPLSLPPSMTS